MTSAECHVCFDSYSFENAKIPMLTFCCSHKICLSCIDHMVQHLSTCPWCKRKWVGRFIKGKCKKVSVEQHHQQCRMASKEDSPRLEPVSVLGEGVLRQEYEVKMREMAQLREETHREQVNEDSAMAMALNNTEQEQILALKKAEEDDIEFAKSLQASFMSETVDVKAIIVPAKAQPQLQPNQSSITQHFTAGSTTGVGDGLSTSITTSGNVNTCVKLAPVIRTMDGPGPSSRFLDGTGGVGRRKSVSVPVSASDGSYGGMDDDIECISVRHGLYAHSTQSPDAGYAAQMSPAFVGHVGSAQPAAKRIKSGSSSSSSSGHYDDCCSSDSSVKGVFDAHYNTSDSNALPNTVTAHSCSWTSTSTSLKQRGLPAYSDACTSSTGTTSVSYSCSKVPYSTNSTSSDNNRESSKKSVKRSTSGNMKGNEGLGGGVSINISSPPSVPTINTNSSCSSSLFSAKSYSIARYCRHSSHDPNPNLGPDRSSRVSGGTWGAGSSPAAAASSVPMPLSFYKAECHSVNALDNDVCDRTDTGTVVILLDDD